MLPLLAQAAGLGRLVVHSALGQPLSAEVEIISLQPGEDDGLSARLAPAEAFRQAGIELNPALAGVRLTVERRDGKSFIRLSSAQPVNEPFLELLVELQWNTGRLVREYTFLLDPPAFRTTPPVAAAPSAAPAAPSALAPTEPVRAEPLAPPPALARAAATHEVRRGDTLANVARRNMPEGVSFNQMLVALYRANTEAFEASNLNRLREGRILNIPDRQSVAAVDSEEARRIVQRQAVEFNDYRRRLAGAVAAAPGEAPSGQRSASGAITAPSPAPSPAPRDELKLSKADPAKPSAAGSSAARADDATARERALKEAQSRVADLERNVADLQKLLEIRNKQLADLQAKAEKPAPDAKAPAVPTPAPASKVAPSAAESKGAPTPPQAESKAAPQPAPAPSTAVPPAPAPGSAAPQSAEAPKPPAPKPAAKPKPAPAAPPPPPSLLDEFLGNPMALAGLALVVLLLAGYGAWAWRRKKKAAQASFHDGLVAPTFAAAGAGAAVRDDVLPESAGAPAAGAPDIGLEPEEVDPVAEADVYMAYGRDAQAEEILKEALQKDPKRVPVLAKLVEIYAHRHDAKALEQAALKLKGLTSGAGPEWDKAAALGRSIDPQNGLYAGAGGEQAAAAATPPGGLDFDFDAVAPEPTAAAAPGDLALDLDLSIPGPDAGGRAAQFAADKNAKAQPAPDLALDLDLSIPGPGAAEKLTQQAAAEKKPEPDLALDFDLSIPGPGAGEKATAQQFSPNETLVLRPDQAADLSGGLDFDLGTPAEQPQPEKGAPSHGGLDFDLGVPAAKEQPAQQGGAIEFDLGTAAAAEQPKDESGAIDFDLETPAAREKAKQDNAVKPASAADLGLDFDLGLGDVPAAEPIKASGRQDAKADFAPSPATASAPAAGGSGSIDFDLDLDLGDTKSASADQKPAAEAPVDLSSISLDLGLPAEAPAATEISDPHWQEVATKLDLARAYEEMGDKSGARELLNEVLKEGDSTQQNQAQEILVRLG